MWGFLIRHSSNASDPFIRLSSKADALSSLNLTFFKNKNNRDIYVAPGLPWILNGSLQIDLEDHLYFPQTDPTAGVLSNINPAFPNTHKHTPKHTHTHTLTHTKNTHTNTHT